MLKVLYGIFNEQSCIRFSPEQGQYRSAGHPEMQLQIADFIELWSI